MDSVEARSDILIVGMGLCGLSAASVIDDVHPNSWLGLDKGRAPGGRMATRRVGEGAYDHGAQFFTVRSAEFGLFVRDLIAKKIVREWCRGFKGRESAGMTDGFPRYIASHGMNQIAKCMAQNLTSSRIFLGRRITRLAYDDGQWLAFDQDNFVIKSHNVLLTAPVPQSVEIVRDVMSESDFNRDLQSLAAIHYDPCLAIMGTFQLESIPDLSVPYQFNHGKLAFLSDNFSKGVSRVAGALTIHLSADISRECIGLPDVDIINMARESLRAEFPGYEFRILGDVSVQRWKYATPKTVFDVPFLELVGRKGSSGVAPRLFFAGEAFGGPRIESAFLSGIAVGKRLVELVS